MWPSIELGPLQTEAMAMSNTLDETNNVDAVLQVTPGGSKFSAPSHRFLAPIEYCVWNPVKPRCLSKTNTALF